MEARDFRARPKPMKATTLQALSEAFELAGVRFIVVGGLAVVAHGYLRATEGIDVVIELLPESVARGFAAMDSLGYMPSVPVTATDFAEPEKRRLCSRERNMTVLQFWSDQHRETPVDLFIEKPFDFGTAPGGAELRFARVEAFDPDERERGPSARSRGY